MNQQSKYLDGFRTAHYSLSEWYCKQVDWNHITPILPLIRTELNYIAAATRLEAMADVDNLKKH